MIESSKLELLYDDIRVDYVEIMKRIIKINNKLSQQDFDFKLDDHYFAYYGQLVGFDTEPDNNTKCAYCGIKYFDYVENKITCEQHQALNLI